MDQTLYVLGPDGLPARKVGPWVERKVHFVDRYAHMFATGMKNKWSRRPYIELFAGPGLSYDRARRRFIEGSAIRALDAEFTEFVFVDIDETVLGALEARIKARGETRPVKYIPGDCNAVIDGVGRALPHNALTLAFVDPTNWQIRFETVKRLILASRVDLLLTFHIGSMRRVAWVSVPLLDAFFGSVAWRDVLGLPREVQAEELLRLYNQQLEKYGYLPQPYHDAPTIRNSKGVLMYVIAFFTKNQRGLDFWKKSVRVDEGGQPQLPL